MKSPRAIVVVSAEQDQNATRNETVCSQVSTCDVGVTDDDIEIREVTKHRLDMSPAPLGSLPRRRNISQHMRGARSRGTRSSLAARQHKQLA